MNTVTEPTTQKRQLRVLSNSEITTFRRCAREHHYTYGLRRRPRVISDALRFGTLIHHALEAWWMVGLGEPDLAQARWNAAVTAIREHGAKSDAFERVRAEELMLGYTARWGDDSIPVVAVEAKFTAPLINPETGAASKTFQLGGKLDVITASGFVEHKTTSHDIEEGSAYWRRVSALDSQVSTYEVAKRAFGIEGNCLYDVIRKPALRPLRATPVESRKYTKEGKLYANQREHDETPEEYRARLRVDISEQPTKYFARGEVPRLDGDMREHAVDTWRWAQLIREAERVNVFPRNPDACIRYGRECDFFGVCSGSASIDDDTLFRTADTAHEELAEKEIQF